MSLPQNLPLNLMQTQWGAKLNPLLSNVIVQGVALNGILLDANKSKDIAHGLGRTPLGWFLIDLLSQATVWRTQPLTNTIITLEASADTTVSLWVF